MNTDEHNIFKLKELCVTRKDKDGDERSVYAVDVCLVGNDENIYIEVQDEDGGHATVDISANEAESLALTLLMFAKKSRK